MNDITLDFGATAQKQTEGETPVVLLALAAALLLQNL